MKIKLSMLYFLTIVLFTILSNGVYAQLDENVKAKLYFTEAQKLYEQGDFKNSLVYVDKAESTIGKPVARTLALKIKIYYNLGEFIEAKKSFDDYTNHYMKGASEELNNEVLSMFINIEEAAKAAEAAAAAKKAAEAEKKAAEEAKRRAADEAWAKEKQEEAEAAAARESYIKNNGGILIDPRDGKIYKTIKMGDQVWTAENLRYEPKNGSYCYEGKNEYCDEFGRLYTWKAASKVCPTGWHLPSEAEWMQLLTFVKANGKDNTYKSLTTGDVFHGTDDYGFSAKLGGYRKFNYPVKYDGGSGYQPYRQGRWWSSTQDETETKNAKIFTLYSERSPNSKKNALSVRCIKD